MWFLTNGFCPSSSVLCAPHWANHVFGMLSQEQGSHSAYVNAHFVCNSILKRYNGMAPFTLPMRTLNLFDFYFKLSTFLLQEPNDLPSPGPTLQRIPISVSSGQQMNLKGRTVEGEETWGKGWGEPSTN